MSDDYQHIELVTGMVRHHPSSLSDRVEHNRLTLLGARTLCSQPLAICWQKNGGVPKDAAVNPMPKVTLVSSPEGT